MYSEKTQKLAFWLILSAILAYATFWTSEKDITTLLGVIASLCLGLSAERLSQAFVDLTDTTNWMISRRKLMRGGFIDGSTPIRISFAYLFRIKIGNKYLLILNGRNTGKYQPIGGVYKMSDREKMDLKDRFHVVDDDKLPIDETSRDDYRLYVPNKYLRSFVRRFDRTAARESVQDLGREFREELVDSGILCWDRIRYRYCGRHITDLHYEKHFQTYELLLADIVELCPSQSQIADLERLANHCPEILRLASAGEIYCMGVKTEEYDLSDSIASHTYKILQDEEANLLSSPKTGNIYSIKLR